MNKNIKSLRESMPLPKFDSTHETEASIRRRISHFTGFPASKVVLVGDVTFRNSPVYDGKRVCTGAGFRVLGRGYSTDFEYFDLDPAFDA